MTVDVVGRSAPKVSEFRLMHESPAVFMTKLCDEQGQPLIVAAHIEEWLRLFHESPRFVLLAPRDHGKTITLVCYLLWLCWRHNRHPDLGNLLAWLPDGTWEAIIFSAQLDQAAHFFEKFQSLLLANENLFGDVIPDLTHGRRATMRDVWSQRRTRLKNRAEISIRAYGTATRGLHPDLLILDDVLTDENTGSSYQRDKTWRYFSGTLMPMSPTQFIVVGTAFRHDDLLHRLRGAQGTPDGGLTPIMGFKSRKYRAIDADNGTALWSVRHPI
jgi:hypothetical protein